MSNKPVAAYAFVDKDYPQRVIYAFLNKVLGIFFEKFGEKWRQFAGDQNLNIQAIS